jgi:hypothetical protein
MSKDEAEVLSIDGHQVPVTHPSKLYFSKQIRLTKLDLVIQGPDPSRDVYPALHGDGSGLRLTHGIQEYEQ